MDALAQKYHFIGIGGIGVSAVARVLHQRGVAVQGSDVRESQLTEGLRALGIPVVIGHRPENIKGADVVVYSTAVPEDNIERAAARVAGVPERHRADLLGLCLTGTDSVGVTGTHGKGTVSAMITHCLIAAGRDPTFVIGGLLNNYGTNARAGTDPVSVAEVDESDRSHLRLRPRHVVVNNIEVDHLNFYSGLDDIIETMATFINENRELKTLAINWDDAGARALAERVSRSFVRYGTGDAPLDYSARDVEDLGERVRFVAHCRGEPLGTVTLPIPGAYNADNAAGALAVVLGAFGVPFEVAQAALGTFRGLENRFGVRRAGGLVLVKDYISHPTGMRRVLESARRIPHRRLFAVFKPYRYTLMRYHGAEYAEAFQGADEVVITTMYAAQERPIDGISTEWFVDVLRGAGNAVAHVPENAQVVPHLESVTGPGDMVVFFGGDDFFQMADAWADARELHA